MTITEHFKTEVTEISVMTNKDRVGDPLQYDSASVGWMFSMALDKHEILQFEIKILNITLIREKRGDEDPVSARVVLEDFVVRVENEFSLLDDRGLRPQQLILDGKHIMIGF